MPLQTTGEIDFGDINLELGNSETAQLALGSSSARSLAGVSSGAIKMSDFYGASSNSAPPMPGTLSYSSLDHDSVRVAWGSSSDPDGDSVTYDIEYKVNGTTTWTRDRTGTSNTYEYIYSLDGKTTYDVRVRAYDGSLYSSWREDINAFTTANSPPSTPGSLYVSSGPSATTVRVAWGASSDPDGDSVTYDIDYRKNTTTTWTRDRTGETNTNEYISGLDGNTTYDIRVRAYDGQDYSSWRYGYDLFTTENSAPTTPGTISASSIGETTVTVSWGASSDPENDSITYNIDYRKDGTTTWVRDRTGETNTNEYISGLDSGSTYDIRVQAYDGQDYSSWRYAYDLFTTDTPNSAPTAPSYIQATSIESDSVRILWGSSSDPDGDSITYYYSWKPSSSSTWVYPPSTTNTYADITGLNSNTTYDVRVFAQDSHGAQSSWRYSYSAFTTSSSASWSGLSYTSDQVYGTLTPDSTSLPELTIYGDVSGSMTFSGTGNPGIDDLGGGDYRSRGTGVGYYIAVNGISGNVYAYWYSSEYGVSSSELYLGNY